MRNKPKFQIGERVDYIKGNPSLDLQGYVVIMVRRRGPGEEVAYDLMGYSKTAMKEYGIKEEDLDFFPGTPLLVIPADPKYFKDEWVVFTSKEKVKGRDVEEGTFRIKHAIPKKKYNRRLKAVDHYMVYYLENPSDKTIKPFVALEHECRGTGNSVKYILE